MTDRIKELEQEVDKLTRKLHLVTGAFVSVCNILRMNLPVRNARDIGIISTIMSEALEELDLK